MLQTWRVYSRPPTRLQMCLPYVPQPSPRVFPLNRAALLHSSTDLGGAAFSLCMTQNFGPFLLFHRSPFPFCHASWLTVASFYFYYFLFFTFFIIGCSSRSPFLCHHKYLTYLVRAPFPSIRCPFVAPFLYICCLVLAPFPPLPGQSFSTPPWISQSGSVFSSFATHPCQSSSLPPRFSLQERFLFTRYSWRREIN